MPLVGHTRHTTYQTLQLRVFQIGGFWILLLGFNIISPYNSYLSGEVCDYMVLMGEFY